MSSRDANVRFKIEAISDLPTISDQLESLLQLQRQLLTQSEQNARNARTDAATQVAAIQGVTDALKDQTTAGKKAGDEGADGAKRTGKEYDVLSGQIRNFTTLLATAFSISELKQFGQEVVEAKTKIDGFKIALDQLIGTKRESTAVYAQLVELAKTSPFSLEDVVENTVKLKAYGIATSDLIPTMNALGNMASVVGKEKLPLITLAYGQVATTGKLMGDELRQFVEAGIPMYDLLAESMKKPKNEIVELAKQHQISFADIRKAVLDSSEEGGRYYNLMALQAKTLGGEVSNLSDKYFIAKARIGDFFEDTIRGGIRILDDFMDATIGSNSAIQRSITYIESAAAAFVTYKVATNAQAVAQAAITLAQQAGTLAMGTYNLAVITVKGTTEGFTDAQIASAAAARSTWAALAANPIGALVTVIGLAVSAYLAWKAAHLDVTNAISDGEATLIKEQSQLTGLINTALQAEIGTKARTQAIQMLMQQYPDYFAGLNAEKVSNDQLQAILTRVNGSYLDRIALAREAYRVDKLAEEQKALLEQQEALIEKIKQNAPELYAEVGGNVEKLVAKFQSSAVAIRQGDGSDNWSSLIDNGLFGGKPAQKLIEVQNALVENQKQIDQHTKAVVTLNTSAKDQAIGVENARWQAVSENLKRGTDEYQAAQKVHLDKLAQLQGTANTTEYTNTVDHTSRMAQVQKASAEQIELIKLQAQQEGFARRLADLNAGLEMELAAIALSDLTKEQMALASYTVQEKYIKDRVKLEEDMYKNRLAIIDAQEKIEIDTIQRSKDTQAQKLTEIATIHSQFETQRLEAAQAHAKAIEQLEYDSAMNRANLTSTTLETISTVELETSFNRQQTAKEAAETIKVQEDKISKAREETARLTKETGEIEKQTHQEVISNLVQLMGQGSELAASLTGLTVKAITDMDLLTGKSKEAAESRLSHAQLELDLLKKMMDQHDVAIQARVAEGEKNVAGAQKGLAEVNAQSMKAAMGIMQMAFQVVTIVAETIKKNIAETNKAIGDALETAKNSLTETYNTLLELNKQTLDAELAYFQGTTEEKLALIQQYHDRDLELIQARDRVDAVISYQKEVTNMTDEHGRILLSIDSEYKAKKLAAVQNQIVREKELEVEQIQWQIEQAKQLLDTKLEDLQAEMDAFEAQKQREIEILEANLDRQKQLNEQFYSDKQLRLQADDQYRAELLAQGEAREVAALQAAMQRELDRASSAEERTRIVNAFELLIAETHAKYQNAIGDKTKEISLANTEAKAQEADKAQELETGTAAEIKKLKDEIAAKDAQTQQAMKQAQADYVNFVNSANKQMFDATKAQKVAELQAEIAILRGKRNLFNRGRIDSAIDDINAAIGDINSINYGSAPVSPGSVSTGGGSSGSGTSGGIGGSIGTSLLKPTWEGKKSELANNQTELNTANTQIAQAQNEINQLGGSDPSYINFLEGFINDKQTLASTLQGYINTLTQQIAELEAAMTAASIPFALGTDFVEGKGFPDGIDTVPAKLTKGERVMTVEQNKMLAGLTNQDIVRAITHYEQIMTQMPVMRLPEGVVSSSGLQTLNLLPLQQDLKGLAQALKQQKQLHVSIDKNGFLLSETGRQSTTTYHQNLMTR